MSVSSSEMYEVLKNEIINLKIKPGELLPENTLCERFGVSRTPVRAALRRLESTGLVEITPYKGTVVTLLTLDEIRQIVYMRNAIESRVIRDFIEICTPMDIEKMRYIIRKQEVLLESDEINIEDFYYIDAQLHEVWYKATHKMYLWDLISRFQVQYTRFRLLDILDKNNMQRIITEHKQIFEVIEKKQKEKIEDNVSSHFFGAYNRVTKMIERDFSEYFV